MKKSIFSVSQVNAYIKQLFVNDYVINDIWIKGEVSNCKIHSSGHVYFTLKDNNCAISCVLFKSNREYIDIDIKDGMDISARGYISVYERMGQYQFYVQLIQRDGLGQLYQRFELLKKKLEKEGLFDKEKKKVIPMYPKKVGIVTSDTGAAIKDIINVSNRRNPYIQLVLFPSLVQGIGASDNIERGIKYLDQREDIDVIIIGRGGGSIEDLWAFNEENIARAIFKSNTPIISAVGHETDFTISDFVSDLRAPTPSAAAELVIPSYKEIIELLDKQVYKLQSTLSTMFDKYKNIVELNSMKMKFYSPATRVEQEFQYIIDLEEQLNKYTKDILKNKKNKLQIVAETLKALSPITNLQKGYAYIKDESLKQIRSINELSEGQTLTIQMHDGTVKAYVENINKEKWCEDE